MYFILMCTVIYSLLGKHGKVYNADAAVTGN